MKTPLNVKGPDAHTESQSMFQKPYKDANNGKKTSGSQKKHRVTLIGIFNYYFIKACFCLAAYALKILIRRKLAIGRPASITFTYEVISMNIMLNLKEIHIAIPT